MNDATYTPSSGFGLNETVDREGRAKARDGARACTPSMARAHVGVNHLTPCLCAPPCLDTIVPVAEGGGQPPYGAVSAPGRQGSMALRGAHRAARA